MARRTLANLSQSDLQEILFYDLSTGQFRWRASGTGIRRDLTAGCLFPTGYVKIRIAGTLYFAHRLAWLYVHGEWPYPIIDHINGVRSDNRISNLRLATSSQNGGNTALHKRNTSGRKGVTWHRRLGKWEAKIRFNRRCRHIGYFDDLDEAAYAYERVATELFGQFVRVPKLKELRNGMD
jgi:hypothetical protein